MLVCKSIIVYGIFTEGRWVQMKRKTLRRFRRVSRNLLHDRQVVEDLLDEMATKWAMRAERMQTKAFKGLHPKNQ